MGIVAKKKFNKGFFVGDVADKGGKEFFTADAVNGMQVLTSIRAFYEKIKNTGFKCEFSAFPDVDAGLLYLPSRSDEGVSIPKAPPMMGRLYESYTIPGPSVAKGEEIMGLAEYVKIYAEAIAWLDSRLEAIKNSEPELYEFEKAKQGKHCLVSHGIMGISNIGKQPSLSNNPNPRPIAPDVLDAYYGLLYKTGYLEKLSKEPSSIKGLSVPRGRHTGLFPWSKGVDLIPNTVASVVGAIVGTLIFKGEWTTGRVSSIWDSYSRVSFPFYSAIYGARNSASGKPQALYFYNQNGKVNLGSYTQLGPRPRTIAPISQIIKVANRFPAKAILEAIFSTDFHPRDPVILTKRYHSAIKKGMIPVSVDYSNYDTTISGPLQQHFLERAFPRNHSDTLARVNDNIKLELTAPWVTPARAENTEMFLFRNDLKMLMSGATTTTSLGCSTNVCLVAEAVSRVMNVRPFQGYMTDYDWFNLGDDLVLFVPPRFADAVISYLSQFGVIVKREEGGIFLMRAFMRSGAQTNLISRILQNFFEPEKSKTDPGIISLGLAANLSLIKDHPLRGDFIKYMDTILSKYRFALHSNCTDVLNWFMTDDMKQYVADYAKASIKHANEVNDIMVGLSSGAVGFTSSLLDNVLGIDYEVPEIKFDLNILSEGEVERALISYAEMMHAPQAPSLVTQLYESKLKAIDTTNLIIK